jgi:hypothetical protein
MTEWPADYVALSAGVDLAPFQTVVTDLGDPSLLTATHPAPDLVHWLSWLESRVTAVEAGGGGAPLPSPEGYLDVDNYGGGFIRVRDTSHLLTDGQVHPVTMRLATVAGPGGAVISDPPGVPASTNPVWFDNGGTLGYVNGTTGAHVTQTTLRNWVKYGDPAVTGYYLLWCHQTVDTDPTKPLLVIDRIASVTL